MVIVVSLPPPKTHPYPSGSMLYFRVDYYTPGVTTALRVGGHSPEELELNVKIRPFLILIAR